MKCKQCGCDNREYTNFCMKCGTKLEKKCGFCWVEKKSNHDCGFGEHGCPGYELFLKKTKAVSFDPIRIVANGINEQKDREKIHQDLAREIQEKLKQLNIDELTESIKEVSVSLKDKKYLILLQIGFDEV